MAVTFHDIPAAYSTTDNPLLYRFSSNQTAQANFSFIVKTYYNGSLVHTDKVFPEVGIYAHWDASNVVTYLAEKPTLKNSLHIEAGTIKSLYITVTENYGTPPVNQATAASSLTQVFKGRLSDSDWIATDFATQYRNVRFLTNSPLREKTILRGVDSYLSLLVYDGAKLLTMRFYSATGSLLHTYTTTLTFQIWQMNVKSSLLTTTAGVPDINAVAYFTVQIGTSETYTFRYHDETCYDAHQLLWINEFGCPDQFVFSHNNIVKGTTKYDSYKKKFGAWSGNSYVFDLNNSGMRNFFTQVEEKGEIVSGWLTEQEQHYLTEMYRSPFHVLFNAVGDKINIRLLDASYEYKDQDYEELFNEIVTYEKAEGMNSIRL
jgi:hypothetical protein